MNSTYGLATVNHQAMTTTNDDALLSRYTRVRLEAGAQIIEVCVVEWDGPHNPTGTWIEALRLPAGSSTDEVGRAQRKVLQDQKFFGMCEECSERNLRGHMNDPICHGCLERNHGVVF